jgi:glycosyltransferase involved in cell wall biosynthesis
MDSPIVSFIIPVYNGDKYIRKCIDSLINQNYGEHRFEIICIDDCSNDNSKEIIKEYQKINSNIKLIENTVNLKTATVCNIGLDQAKGDFVWIIGQDDWIHDESIIKLAQLISTFQPEVIAFNYRRVDFNENELHSAEVFDNSGLMKGDNYIRSKFGIAFPHYLLGYEWRAIFNRNYLIKKKIRFPDGGIYEDTTFLFKTMLHSKRFVSIPDFFYFYRVNPNSITDFNKKYKGNLVFEFAFKVGNEVLDLAIEIKEIYPDFSVELFKMAKWYFNGFAPKLIGASFKEKMVFYKLLKDNFSTIHLLEIYLNNYSKLLLNNRIGFILSVLIKPLYLIKRKIKTARKPKQEWCY